MTDLLCVLPVWPATPTSWQDWGGVATVVAVGVALVAVYPAYVQLVELVRTRKHEALTGVLLLMSSERARADRRYLHHVLKDKAPLSISPMDRDHIERVCVDFEYIGSLVRHGLVPQQELLEHHSAVIVRTWKVLKPHVEHRNDVLKGDYAHSFVWLGTTAIRFRDEAGLSNDLGSVEFVPDPPVRRMVRRK
jgi:hypothetical protein